MKTEIDNGNVQKTTAPRYIVSIGSFVNEGGALARRDAAAKAGYRSEIIDLRDDNTTTTVAALLLIAEQVERLSKKLDAITECVNGLKISQPPTEAKTEPKQPKTVADLISQYRAVKGYTIRDLSAKTGIPRGTMSNYCSGFTHNIPTKSLLAICEALAIPNEEIIKYL